MRSPKVVFFGSGPVATESLAFLLDNFEVEAVITKPLPEGHRGSMPTIDLAISKNVPFYTPANRKELYKLFSTTKFASKVGIVIDYGIIISGEVIESFTLGIVNSHFSLLPEWRGADPITFSLLSGQKTTGVSLMLINEKMDEGPLVAQEKLSISQKDDSITLTTKLIELSNSMISKNLPGYFNDKLSTYPQVGEPTYSRKLTKSDGQIDWTKPAEQIEREIRAYYVWPKSFVTFGSHLLTIRQSQVVDSSGEPGTYKTDKKSMIVYCGKGALNVIRLQPAGKKEMPVSAFLAGNQL